MQNSPNMQMPHNDCNQNISVQPVSDNLSTPVARCPILYTTIQNTASLPSVQLGNYHPHLTSSHVSVETVLPDNTLHSSPYRHLLSHQIGLPQVIWPENYASISNPWAPVEYHIPPRKEDKPDSECKDKQQKKERMQKEMCTMEKDESPQQTESKGSGDVNQQKESNQKTYEEAQKQSELSSVQEQDQNNKAHDLTCNKTVKSEASEGRRPIISRVQNVKLAPLQNRKKVYRQPLKYAVPKSEGQSKLVNEAMKPRLSLITYSKQDPVSHPAGKVATLPVCTKPCISSAKPNASYNAFGYQPSFHSFIAQAQLKAREELQNNIGSETMSSTMMGSVPILQQTFSSCAPVTAINANIPSAIPRVSMVSDERLTHANVRQAADIKKYPVTDVNASQAEDLSTNFNEKSSSCLKPLETGHCIRQDHGYHTVKTGNEIGKGSLQGLNLMSFTPQTISTQDYGNESNKVAQQAVSFGSMPLNPQIVTPSLSLQDYKKGCNESQSLTKTTELNCGKTSLDITKQPSSCPANTSEKLETSINKRDEKDISVTNLNLSPKAPTTISGSHSFKYLAAENESSMPHLMSNNSGTMDYFPSSLDLTPSVSRPSSAPCTSEEFSFQENAKKRKLKDLEENHKRQKTNESVNTVTGNDISLKPMNYNKVSVTSDFSNVPGNSLLPPSYQSVPDGKDKVFPYATKTDAYSQSVIPSSHTGFFDSFKNFVDAKKETNDCSHERKRKPFHSEDSRSSSSIVSALSITSQEHRIRRRRRKHNRHLLERDLQESSDEGQHSLSRSPSNSSEYSGSGESSDGGERRHPKHDRVVHNRGAPRRRGRKPGRRFMSSRGDLHNSSRRSSTHGFMSSDEKSSSSSGEGNGDINSKHLRQRRARLAATKFNRYSLDEDGSNSGESKYKNDFLYDPSSDPLLRKKISSRARGRPRMRSGLGRVRRVNSLHRVNYCPLTTPLLWLSAPFLNKPRPRGRPPRVSALHRINCSRQFDGDHTNPVDEPYLQDGPCLEAAPKLPKCRECRISAQHKTMKMTHIFCRFFAFRKLCYRANGTLVIAGFSLPSEATPNDLKLWLPPEKDPPADLNVETSNFLLTHVGDQFCDLVEQEKEAKLEHMGEDKTIHWKSVVQGVREMCDVCETTLFNVHWVCRKCGFVVCIDCYKARKNGTVKEEEFSQRSRDEYQWLHCSNHQPHDQSKLMLTQIIASTVLWDVAKTMHEVRKKWNIQEYCKCSSKPEEPQEKPPFNGICKQLMSAVTKTFDTKREPSVDLSPIATRKEQRSFVSKFSPGFRQEENIGSYNLEVGASPLRWLADVALTASGNMPENQDMTTKNRTFQENEETITLSTCVGSELLYNGDENNFNFSSLQELVKSNKKTAQSAPLPSKKPMSAALDEIIRFVIQQREQRDEITEKNKDERQLKHFSRRYPQPRNGHDPLPIRICTLTESRLLFPSVPHLWLCNGKLLLLKDPTHVNNLGIFQEQWKRGQPVLVAGVSSKLDMSLWHPSGFCRDFGDIKNDLVNCKTGAILQDLPMRMFWEGFENFSKRMKDQHGEYMLLKLKDWPPGEDFSEMLPSRFQDLMKVLPLPQYTHRDGVLNLAGRLPECFVRPDLGPKMYNAYGSALYPTKGTTNLHLDISDAVNVMVYVGIPNDGKDEDHIQEALKAIDEGGCDSLMRKRVREKGVKPGALWHIFNARDADKIRDLLNKVAIERGEKLEAHHDPIHDQSWYLDEELRDRLYKEYGVEGYAIAQCLGDSVFIPAGAPHQVRNLHSCIKVAEDFVSPENIAHCFTLTQEFRHLSDTHTNHEDKLQIKNIIYHAVKDALALLQTRSPSPIGNHQTPEDQQTFTSSNSAKPSDSLDPLNSSSPSSLANSSVAVPLTTANPPNAVASVQSVDLPTSVNLPNTMNPTNALDTSDTVMNEIATTQ